MRILQKKNQIKEGAEQVSEALIKFGLDLKGLISKSLFLVIILLFTNTANTTPGLNTGDITASAISIQRTPEQLYVDNLKSEMKGRLVKEVDTYIERMAPNSRLNSEHLVTKCLEYDTDIIFVLSQALLESHFGTKGKAAETNSVWNVGAYDNQVPRNWYNHPDESLEPYLKLVNEKYLIEVTSQGDTIFKDLHHLVQDRGYTNYRGARFASARGYENGMRKLMVRIDMETSINFYQDILTLNEIKVLAFFRPEAEVIDTESLYALN